MKIGIVGCGGRMGQMLVKAVDEAAAATLAGGTERPGSALVGGTTGAQGAPVHDNPAALFADAEAVIDFTVPVATVAHAKLAAALVGAWPEPLLRLLHLPAELLPTATPFMRVIAIAMAVEAINLTMFAVLRAFTFTRITMRLVLAMNLLHVVVSAPLYPVAQWEKPTRHLQPVMIVAGEAMVLATNHLAAVPRAILGDYVASLAEHRTEIIGALDFLFTGV